METFALPLAPGAAQAALQRYLNGIETIEGGAPQVSVPVEFNAQSTHDVLVTFVRTYADDPNRKHVEVVWEPTTGGPIPFPGFEGELTIVPAGAGSEAVLTGRPLAIVGASGMPAAEPDVMLVRRAAGAVTRAAAAGITGAAARAAV